MELNQLRNKKIKYSNSKKNLLNHETVHYQRQTQENIQQSQSPEANLLQYFNNRNQPFNKLVDNKMRQNYKQKQDINTFTIEVCNQQQAQELVQEQSNQPNFFNEKYIEVHNLIQKTFPKAQIFLKSNPRLGSFEIRHMNNLVWSKLLFGKFPEARSFEVRLKNYFHDFINKKNLTKYEYPDSEDTVQKIDPSQLTYASKIYNNNSSLLNNNINVNSNNFTQSVQSYHQSSNNTPEKHTHKSNMIPNIFNNYRNSIPKTSEQPQRNNKRIIATNNEQYQQIRRVLQSTGSKRLPNNSHSLSQQFPQTTKNFMQSQDASPQNSKMSTNRTAKYPGQQSSLMTMDNSKQNGLVYKNNGVSQNRYNQNNIPDSVLLDCVDAPMEYTDPNYQPSTQEQQAQDEQQIKAHIEQFWTNFKIYYLGFKYNPSIKRISLDIQDILKKVQLYIINYKEDYQQQINKVFQVNQENKQKQQKIDQNDSNLQNIRNEHMQEIQKLQDELNGHQSTIQDLSSQLQQKMKECEQNKNTIQKLEDDMANQTREKNNSISHLESQLQKQIEHYEHQLEKQKKELSNHNVMNNMQITSQKNLLEQRQQRVEYLEKQVEEKDKELKKVTQEFCALKRQNSLVKGEVRGSSETMKNLDEIVKKLRNDNDKHKNELDNHRQKSEKEVKQMQEKMVNLQAQFDMIVDTTYQTYIPNSLVMKVGIYWNNSTFQKEDSCDLQCLMINKLGDIDQKIDHIFYNQQQELHEDDQEKTGIQYLGIQEGKVYDRDLTINFKEVPQDIHALAIVISTRTHNLSQLKRANVHYSIDGMICNFQNITSSNGKACMLAVIQRNQKNQNWKFVQVQKSYPSLSLQNMILDNLSYTGLKISDNVKQALKWTKNCGKLLKIKGGEQLPVPEAAYEDFVVGMGWDTGSEGIDIDSSVLMFTKDGELYDNISFQNLSSKCGSIQHKGDERTGDAEGDDEQIHINLNNIPDDVYQCWVFICIYDDDKYFDIVDNAYCRFLASDSEFCRFDMTQIKESGRNGVLMCDLVKIGKKWSIRGRDYFTKETLCSDHVIPIIQQINKGNLSDIKIIQI